jgi:hypothetical protein
MVEQQDRQENCSGFPNAYCSENDFINISMHDFYTIKFRISPMCHDMTHDTVSIVVY